MIKEFMKCWNECTTFGRIVLVMCIVPCLILDMLDYIWTKNMEMCDKLEKWRYKTFWIKKEHKENYERRNSNKS